MDLKWTKKWTKHRPKMDKNRKWIKNGSKMDLKWNKNGPKLEQIQT